MTPPKKPSQRRKAARPKPVKMTAPPREADPPYDVAPDVADVETLDETVPAQPEPVKRGWKANVGRAFKWLAEAAVAYGLARRGR